MNGVVTVRTGCHGSGHDSAESGAWVEATFSARDIVAIVRDEQGGKSTHYVHLANDSFCVHPDDWPTLIKAVEWKANNR